ncbi:hypothetical protein PMAYCL1PPCAC_07345, partial [Pristionchus mayeri]
MSAQCIFLGEDPVRGLFLSQSHPSLRHLSPTQQESSVVLLHLFVLQQSHVLQFPQHRHSSPSFPQPTMMTKFEGVVGESAAVRSILWTRLLLTLSLSLSL